MKSLLLIPSLLICSLASASAAVYLNDVVIDEATNIPTLSSGGWASFGRVMHLTQSPNGFFVVEVNRLTPKLEFEFIHRSLAGDYALFQVNSGDELSYNKLPLLRYGGWSSSAGGNTLTLGAGQEAYIGYWSQRNGKPVAGPESNDIFGWAKVRVSAGQLVVTASASADTGIIVGTTQAIPEPNSMMLASVGTLLFLRRNRKRSTKLEM